MDACTFQTCATSFPNPYEGATEMPTTDHYVALNRGVEGFKQTDFITGTANTQGVNTMELRIQDAANLTKKDVVNALKAFERFIETVPWVVAAGFDVKL